MPGIVRPAIAAQWPTVKRPSIVLDLGANVGATARELADFAVSVAAMARAMFRVERTDVALLNIGVEEIKGVEEVKQAHSWLKDAELPFDYRALRRRRPDRPGVPSTSSGRRLRREHRAQDGRRHRQAGRHLLARGADEQPIAKIGALLARGGLLKLKARMDPRQFQTAACSLGSTASPSRAMAARTRWDFASAIPGRLRHGRERHSSPYRRRSHGAARQTRRFDSDRYGQNAGAKA